MPHTHRTAHALSTPDGRAWEILRKLWESSANSVPFRTMREGRSHLFSAAAVTITPTQAARIAALAAAVEQALALPAYQCAALDKAPAIARFDPASPGAFVAFDLHLTPDGLRLIEINSNAGGGFLNSVLAHAWHEHASLEAGGQQLRDRTGEWFAMLQTEWRLQRGEQALTSVAIVDEDPENQFLYPEFLLCREMFRAHGIPAVIADPAQLALRDGALWFGETRIDMVYNRLTDFYLEEPRHLDLRAAYLDGSVALTPHPRNHALYADKRNLIPLGNPALLRSWGLAEALAEQLAAVVPAMTLVDAESADMLWANRRNLFFKPVAGFGSKGAYRGDKLTKRVWGEIVGSEYVAQTYAPAHQQDVQIGAESAAMKVDLRCYAYRGQVQLLAARLYRGQTTNFRTLGGGFAPVFVA